MSTAPYNELLINVDEKNYFFTVEEFHSKPVPPKTIMIVSERTYDKNSGLIPVFKHQYIAVDTGFTSSSYMIHPLQSKMNTFILTCIIDDADERLKVVQYIKETSEAQSHQKEG
jgi:hypothetical protein